MYGLNSITTQLNLISISGNSDNQLMSYFSNFVFAVRSSTPIRSLVNGLSTPNSQHVLNTL